MSDRASASHPARLPRLRCPTRPLTLFSLRARRQHAHIYAAELPAHYVIGEDGIPIYPGMPPAFGGGEPDRAADPSLAPHLA